GLRNDLERLKRALEAKDSLRKTKKEGLLLVELLAGCTSTSKAAHAVLKMRKQLTSNTRAAHATPRGCARSFLAPAELLAQQTMVHMHLAAENHPI
ncbi:hypothetical protein PIB30_099413, partial [Stylosanthes scabra]|nr:hypothetical protein [Stylosanthes scabra]